MLNIPTELLRTLLIVVDRCSFTQAGQVLGITQPAVSSQIKRLQFLLGYELIDKTRQGVVLTPRGEMVAAHARRLLAINDQIAFLGGDDPPKMQTLRVGIPGDYAGVALPATLAQLRRRWSDIRFKVTSMGYEAMLRGLRQGDIDLCIAIANSVPSNGAHQLWIEDAVWVRSDATDLDPDAPIPLVSFGEDCSCRYAAVNALTRAGRECEPVFTARSIASLEAAVLAGLGVMVLPRSQVAQTALSIWDDAPLPELHPLYCGVFLRPDVEDRLVLEDVADEIARVLRPRPSSAPPLVAPVPAAVDLAEATDMEALCEPPPPADALDAATYSGRDRKAIGERE